MMPSSRKRQMPGIGTPAGIALLYAIIAALWIILSGHLLAITVDDPLLQSRIELAKGLAFVAVTSGLLYLLLNHWHESHAMQPATDQTELPASPKTIRLVLIFIALVLLVPLIGFVVYELNVPQIEKNTFNNLKSIAQFKAEEIENWLNERNDDAQWLIADAGFARDVNHFLLSRKHDAGLLKQITVQLASIQADNGFDSIMLLDTGGRLITSLGKNVELSQPIRNLMHESLDSKQIERSNLYRDESGRIHLDWIVPLLVSDQHGKRPVATMVLRTMPERFLYPMIQTWPTASPSGETLLVRREGTSILHLNPLRHGNDASLAVKSMNNPLLPAVAAIRANRPSTVFGQDYRGVQVLAAYRPMPGTDWYLIAKIDRDEVMMPLWNMLYWIGVIASAAVGLIIVLLMLHLRQIQRFHRLALQARSAASLRENNELLRLFIEHAPVALAMFDRDMRYLAFSRRWMTDYALGEQKLIGRSHYEVFPEIPARWKALHARALAGEVLNSNEDPFERADGTVRWMKWEIRPWKTNDGDVGGIVIFSEDITERKQSEDALRDSHEALSRLLNAMAEGAYGIDNHGICTFVNQSFLRILGYQNDNEVLGKHIHELIHHTRPDGSPYPESECRAYCAYRTGLPITASDEVFWRKDGVAVPVEYWSHTIMENGVSIGAIVTFIDITERKAAEEKILRLTQLYAALSQCNEAIVRCNSEEELFPEICRDAVQFGGMSMAWIGMVDEASKQVRPVASYGTGLEYLEGIQISVDAGNPFGRGPVGTAIRDNRPFWCQDYEHDPAIAPWLERGNKAGWKAIAALPLHRNGTPSGILALYSATLNAFDEEARHLLTEMATDISFALDNFDRESQRKQAQQELEFKNTVLLTQQETTLDAILVVDENGQIISYNRQFIDLWPAAANLVGKGDDAPVLRSVVDQVVDQEAFLDRIKYLYEHRDEKSRDEISLKNGRVLDRYSAPISGADGHYYGRVWYFRDITEARQAERELLDSEQRFRGLVEQSLAGIYIIQDGKLVYVNPRAAEIVGYGSVDDLIGKDIMQFIAGADHGNVAENIRKLLCKEVPNIALEFRAVHTEGHTITVGANASYAFYHGQPAVIGLIQDISEKKHDEERILNYVDQLKSAFLSTVQLATSLSEMRDPYTAGHERRVSDIAVAIATGLGLDDQRIEGIKVAGYLHDIGKISIPSEILVKPGRLNATEYALVQGHAQASYEVLKIVPFPWPVATIALQHHERIDGSGYPHKLKGDEILFESRIMAVADVVEAMASHRPYRAGLGIDKALAEIEQGRGTLYDPAVADACLRLFREQGYELPPL